MTPLAWIAFLLLGSALTALAAWAYTRREPPVRGRPLLLALRAAAVLLVLLLIFDPDLPRVGADRPARTAVVVDVSLSMALPAEPGSRETRWQRALVEARAAGGGDALRIGGAPGPVPVESLAVRAPDGPDSRASAALRSAVEGGADRILVLTDGELQDASSLAGWLPDAPARVEVRRVAGARLPDRVLSEADAPTWAEAGEAVPVRVAVELTTPGGPGVTPGDTAWVVVRQGVEVRAREPVALPEPGRSAPLVLQARPVGSGLVRLDVALEPADAVPDDDLRTVYVRVAEEPAGVVLVSLRPDWEPRFLLPVLGQATGLPARGFLRLRGGSYRRVAAGEEAAAPVAEEVVRRAARDADLLVLHGVGAAAPPWLLDAGRASRRLLVLPGDGSPPGLLPVAPGPPRPGDWYLAPEVPSSPVAPLLAGLAADSIPPLPGLRPLAAAAGPERAWVALEAREGRRGAPAPMILAGERPSGARWVATLGDGTWRWAFRPGASRLAYRQLWSALAGWLLAGEATAAGAAVRPARLAVPRGEPIVWRAPGLGADSLEVRVERIGEVGEGPALGVAGAAAPDTATFHLSVRGDSASLPLPPAHYRYEARALAAGEEVGTGRGPLTVERYTAELARPRVTLPEGGTPRAAGAGGGGTPLHTLPWAYLAVVALLAVEWTLRRRWGLR